MSYYAHHNENARKLEADARSREMNPNNPIRRAVVKKDRARHAPANRLP